MKERDVAVSDWLEIIECLKSRGVVFEDGLSSTELLHNEQRFGFLFPPDIREFLQAGLPQGEGFPDWRSGDETLLRERLEQPLEGILFDIEHNGFWMPDWEPRSNSLDEAMNIARHRVAEAPTLIPIYSHRMIPDDPLVEGNPVFSVHQTDIIYYGIDLRDYLANEFFRYSLKQSQFLTPERAPREIRFWSDLTS